MTAPQSPSQTVKEIVKDAVTVLPAFHLLLVVTFLLCYYLSFGRSLASFSSPTEVFSVSLSDVGPAYVFGGTGMIMGWLSRPRSLLSSGEVKTEPFSKLLIGAVLLLTAISAIVSYLVYYITGYIYFFLAIFAIALTVGIGSGFVLTKMPINAAMKNPIYLLVSCLLVVCVSGLSAGQNDRTMLRSDMESHPYCKTYRILRPLGDNFLAASQDNSRIIIDEDCKAKFVIFDRFHFVPRPNDSPKNIIVGYFLGK